MSIQIWDSGPLIALEDNNRRMWALFNAAWKANKRVQIPAGVIGEIWRGSRQARLNQALGRCTVVPMDNGVARSAGLLCALTETNGVIDASVAVTAALATSLTDVEIVTSDVKDIRLLVDAASGIPNFVSRSIEIIRA